MRVRPASMSGVAGMLAVFAVAMWTGAGPAGAATTPSWSAWQPYTSLTLDSTAGTATGSAALPVAIACPDYGNCIAAGAGESISGLEPDVMVETGAGQWAQPSVAPLPADTGSGPLTLAFLTSVACSDASSCVAVGVYYTAAGVQRSFAVSFTLSGSSVSFGTPEPIALPSGAATDSTQLGFPSGVSCGAGGCTAVGTYVTSGGTWAAFTASPGPSGAWTAAAVAAPAGAVDDSILNAISCPSTGPCEAVGNYADSSNYQQAWAVQVDGGVAGTAEPVALYSGSTSAVDTAPTVVALRLFRPGLAAVSCPSAGVCTAVGSVGASATSSAGAVMVPITAGVPGPVSGLSGISSAGGTPDLQAVWCADANDCEASGLQITVDPGAGTATAVPIFTSETDGAWSAPATLQGISSATGSITVANADALACTSDGVCVSGALLSSLDASPAGDLLVTESSYFAYSAVPPTVTTTSLPAATVGEPYTTTLQRSGGSGTGSWSVSQGSLPAGLTLDGTTGVISGTPTASGQDSFIVTATNAGPPSLSATTAVSITVTAAPTVTPGPTGTAAPNVKVAYARISRQTATVVLDCSGSTCVGKFRLIGVEHRRGKTPTSVTAHVRKKLTKRTVTLARGSYTVKAGGSNVLKVKLNSTGAKLLRKLHRISCKLTLTPSDATTATLTKTLIFKSKSKS